MNNQIEALKMAMYELEIVGLKDGDIYNACKEALAEAEKQEPVALIRHENGNFSPAPSWQSLSDDEVREIRNKYAGLSWTEGFWRFYNDVDAKLKEKNHGN